MQIFYLQECDEWKSTDSMRLCFIGTSKQKLRKLIIKKILLGEMNYYDSNLSRKQQALQFMKDWRVETRDEINSNLEYGFIDYTYNNEEI